MTTATKGTAVYWMVVLLAALSKFATPLAQAADSHVEGTMVFVPKEERGVPIGERAVMGARCSGRYAQSLWGQNSGVGQCRATHVG